MKHAAPFTMTAFLILAEGLASAVTVRPSTLPAQDVTRVLIYGDSGDGSGEQIRVGRAMADRHAEDRFHFAVSMGDNQYVDTWDGVWRDIFELPYGPLIDSGLQMFQAVGNHDMEQDRLNDQLRYSRTVDALRRRVGGFVLPSENYVIQTSRVRWIVINVSDAFGSVNISENTMAFAEREVCQDTDQWKIITMHYPFWSTGPRSDNVILQRRLLPLLERCPVDFIFSGHEHHAEWFLPWKWTHFGIVGNAHEIRHTRVPSARESLFRQNETGFAELDLRDDVATIKFVDGAGRIKHEASMQKRPTLWADVWKKNGAKVFGRMEIRDAKSATTIEAQLALSTTRRNPLQSEEGWTFVAARPALPHEYSHRQSQLSLPVEAQNLEHHVFVGRIPENFRGWAAFRYRLGPHEPWIWGDRSEGRGLHGNYDGIREQNLLPVDTR